MRQLLFLVGLFFSTLLYGQPSSLDSLLNIQYNKEEVGDSLYISHLILIMREYEDCGDKENRNKYVKEVQRELQTLNYAEWALIFYSRLGLFFHQRAIYDKALEIYYEGVNRLLFLKRKDCVAQIYLNIASVYNQIPDYEGALKANQTALDIFRELQDDENPSSVYMNIGTMYQKMGKFEKAVDYMQQADSLFVRYYGEKSYGHMHASRGIGNCYLYVSDSFFHQTKDKKGSASKFDLALLFLNQAYTLFEDGFAEAPSEYLQTLKELGDAYVYIGRYQDAYTKYKEGLGILASHSQYNNMLLPALLLGMGNYFTAVNKPDSAIGYLQGALNKANTLSLLKIEEETLRKLCDIYEGIGVGDSALVYYKKYINVKENIRDLEYEGDIVRQQLQLDFTVKENSFKIEQQLAAKELALKTREIKSARIVTYTLLAGLLLVSVMAVWVYNIQRKQKKLNQIISNQKRELEALNLVKDRIFSVIGHDMRMPVNSLIAFSELIENPDIPAEKIRLYTQELKGQLLYTSDLMGNLLQWASSQMKGAEPFFQTLLISEEVDAVIKTLDYVLRQKGIRIDSKIDPTATVYADADMLSVVVRNLLSNAIKFSYPQSVIILSSVNLGGQVVVTFNDTGIGIAAEKLEQINAESITAIESSAGTKKEKGIGLGLLLTKTFVSAMHGSLRATALKERGTTFSLTLPAAKSV